MDDGLEHGRARGLWGTPPDRNHLGNRVPRAMTIRIAFNRRPRRYGIPRRGAPGPPDGRRPRPAPGPRGPRPARGEDPGIPLAAQRSYLAVLVGARLDPDVHQGPALMKQDGPDGDRHSRSRRGPRERQGRPDLEAGAPERPGAVALSGGRTRLPGSVVDPIRLGLVPVAEELRRGIHPGCGADRDRLDRWGRPGGRRCGHDPAQRHRVGRDRLEPQRPGRARRQDLRRDLHPHQHPAEIDELRHRSARLDRHPRPRRQLSDLALARRDQRLAVGGRLAMARPIDLLQRLPPQLESRRRDRKLGLGLGQQDLGVVELLAGDDLRPRHALDATDPLALERNNLLGAVLLQPGSVEVVLQGEPLLGRDADVDPAQGLPRVDPAAQSRPGGVRGSPERAGVGRADLEHGLRVRDHLAVDRGPLGPRHRPRGPVFQPVAFGRFGPQLHDPILGPPRRLDLVLFSLPRPLGLHHAIDPVGAPEQAADQSQGHAPLEQDENPAEKHRV